MYRNATTPRNTLRHPQAEIKSGSTTARLRWLRDQMGQYHNAMVAIVKELPEGTAWVCGALSDPGDAFRVIEREFGKDAVDACVVSLFVRADVLEAEYRKRGG